MTKADATGDIFLTALKALPKAERDAVLLRIARDRSLTRELLDLAVIDRRRHEPSRPLRDFLAERAKK